MKIIKRKRGVKRASTVRANSWRWAVYVQQDGGQRRQGIFRDFNEAMATAREIRRDCHLPAWVLQA